MTDASVKKEQIKMYDESKFIVDSFKKNFESYSGEKIVIYGLGKKTRVILEECGGFQIVGLMDAVRTGEQVWGLPVLSCEEAVQRGVKVIVIVATSINVPVIYQRIAGVCEKYDLLVFDIAGNDLSMENEAYLLPEYYEDLRQEALLDLVKKYDVISFDIFDTLLVRDVLYPTDIFHAVEALCTDILPEDSCFYENRIKAERELSLDGDPDIHKIYELLSERMGISQEDAEALIAAEIAVERGSLHKRKQMVEVLAFAREMGKIVCCTSDMYLTSDILSVILKENDIDGIDKIFVSCEYGASKCSGLFQVVKEWYEGKSILHIGDNQEADIAGAQRYGIEGTFKISSIYQMALDSSFKFILGKCSSYADRCLLGRLLSEQLNDPFLFSRTKGRGEIHSDHECGYYFLEPLLEVLVKWLMQKCTADEIDCLLLGARDGWLIKKVLDLEKKAGNWRIPYLYFYASRVACTLAGMEDRNDVLYVKEQSFDGSLEEELEKRFYLTSEEILKREEGESEEAYFEKHIRCILDLAECARKRYRKYIDRLEIKGDKLGFFDFVASGTCQLWLDKIMNKKLVGYYAARNLEQYKSELDISSLYEPKFVYEKKGELDKNLMFLETIFTSTEPTLKGFDENGECIFGQETRTADRISHLTDIHTGMLAAYEERMGRQYTAEVTLGFAESIVSMLHNEYMIWDNPYYEGNELTEEFCNRRIDLKQVMKEENR